MSVDPASWQPGTLIVNSDGTEVARLEWLRANGRDWAVHRIGAPTATAMSSAELAESWQPLADVAARGWGQRQEAGVDYCLVHDGIRNEDEHRCDFARDDDQCDEDGEPRACRLVPLSYPITEGNNE